MRCSAEQFQRFGRPASRDKSIELRDALLRCEGAEVSVDGVWGGLVGNPSVRLRVRYPDGDAELARTELKYYSVDVSPIAGIASIDYTLSPALYYVNF